MYIFAFVCFGILLQTTFIPLFFSSIGEVLHWQVLQMQTINIVFLVLMYLCFSRNFFISVLWFCILILLQNSFDIPWKGALAFSYFFLLVAVYVLETMFAIQYSLFTMILIFLLVMAQGIFHLLMGSAAMGFDTPLGGEMLRIILMSLIHTVVAPVVFYCLYLIDLKTIFHFDKSKSFFGRRVGL